MIESYLYVWTDAWKSGKLKSDYVSQLTYEDQILRRQLLFVLPTSGELKTFCSTSSAHGVDKSASFKVLARKIPKNSRGKFRGQLHCLGATHTWARGNFLENGPTKILCSYANVGRTMYSTGASSSFRS